MNMITKSKLVHLVAGMLLSIPVSGYAEVNFAQKPLFAGGSVEANMLFILDDSGSMRWGYMPDDLLGQASINAEDTSSSTGCDQYVNYAGVTPARCAIKNNRFLASSYLNKIYYDPKENYLPPLKSDGSRMANASFTAARVNGYDTNSVTVNLSSSYRALMDPYSRFGGGFAISEDRQVEPAFYFTFTDSDACRNNPYNDSCYSKVVVGSEEQQNFANWFSYYRTRLMLSKAGVGGAFAGDLSQEFRLGWGEINRGRNTVDGASVRAVRQGVRRYGDVKSDFYDWLYGQNAGGSTPLRRALEGAGQYYEGSKSAWTDDPSRAADPITNPARECRQSFSILMTDGYYNANTSSDPDLTEYADDTSGPNITTGLDAPYQYQPSAPYSDSYTSRVTLADIAMHYWKRDLRTDIDNYVPVSDDIDNEKLRRPGNPAFWQHMVTYGVGLGVTGSVDPTTAFENALDGNAVDWWGGNSNEDKINDLLHASVNSRGGFYSASNSSEFEGALTAILKDASARAGSSTGLDFSITSFKEGSLLFSAAFDPNGWSGDVKAVELQASEEGEPEIPGEGAAGWSAREVLDERDIVANERNIITYDGDRGRPFRWTELTLDQKADLATGDASLAEDRLAYLRGDRSFETDLTNFRKRSSRLGSIVNSTPRFVAAPDSEWPNSSAFGDGKYSVFRKSNEDRTPVVYAGSNDGMLHAFKGTSGEDGGEELLAYIPEFIYSTNTGEGLHYLTQPSYEHRYYVDLETRVTDMYIQGRNVAGGLSEAGWKTVLIGGGRAGAPGIFALDITDPDSFSESNAQSTVLWEFTHEKLGNLVQPPVVSLADWGGGDYRWTAFVPSGYNTGSTGFFMLDMEGGLDGSWDNGDFEYIEFENGDGLSALTVIDNTSDYIADRVYAGDLDGNMWVAVGGSGGWDSAYKSGSSARPYVTVNKPITGAPTVGPSTSSGKDPNLMILFGTGKYLERSDTGSTAEQSFYGVLESADKKVTITQTDLVERDLRVGTGQVDGVSQIIRFAEGTAVDYETKSGWYADLPVSGERIVTNGVIRGDYVYVSTLIPSEDPCLGGGDGWIMAFDIQEGLVGLDDGESIGAFEDSTYNAMGYKVEGVPSQLKVWDEYLAYDCAGCGAQLDALPPFGLALGRKGWRELTQ